MEDSIRPAFRRLMLTLAIVYTGLLICGIVVLASITKSRNEEMARLITEAVNPAFSVGDTRDAVQILSRLGTSIFESIVFESSTNGLSFTIPPEATGLPARPFDKQINLPIEQGGTPLGHLSFRYSMFRPISLLVLSWAALLFLLVPITSRARRRLLQRHAVELRERAELLRAELAVQVSHDIRAPVAALAAVAANIPELAADKRDLIRSAAKRVNEIADSLLLANRKVTSLQNDEENLTSIVESIVKEKSNSADGPPIKSDLKQGEAIFVALAATDLRRILSNLLNNSVEAGATEISVAIRSQTHGASIVISDNGKGMSQDVAAQAGQKGFTHGKQGGSGLGLSHAKAKIEEAGGKVILQSQEGTGTMVTLSLKTR